MEIEIIENRGRAPKYDFDLKEVGDRRSYPDTNPNKLLGAAKGYCNRRGLDWKFRCYTVDGETFIVRIK